MLKIIGDIITVHLNHMGMKTDTPGKIHSIDYEKVIIQTAHTVFLEFDAVTGEIINDDDADQAYIDVSDIDIPENPFEFIQAKIGDEGFDYCFDGYSRWEDIKDPMFHKLRENYLLSKKALQTYIDNKTA